MSKKIHPGDILESDSEVFTRNVLRVMRMFLEEVKADGRKSWKQDDLIQLLDNMLDSVGPHEVAAEAEVEILLGDDRESCIAAGKKGFETGVKRTDNPQEEGTNLRRWWDIGWHDAERAVKVADGGTVTTQSGRQLGIKQAETGYRIQRKENSVISEWDDILHQYADEGRGSIFSDYDEAIAMAEKLKIGASGIIKVITVKG